MSGRSAVDVYLQSGTWWQTSISNIRKNEIMIRGIPIEELIGNVTFSQMLYFLLCGKLLDDARARLLEAVLVAGSDHGPRAPSIAAARMAATCGISFNSAVATGINMLGDVHGGAVEGAMRLFYETRREIGDAPFTAEAATEAVEARLGDLFARKQKAPGFGHQLHDRDPRVERLYELAGELAAQGVISGSYLDIADRFRIGISRKKRIDLTMNIDGVSAAIQCELDIPAEAAKGIFAISRGIGIVAHANEELQAGALVKGPCPNLPELVKYTGSGRRHLHEMREHNEG